MGEVVASTAIAAALSGPPRPARVLGASAVAVYLVAGEGGPEPDVVAVVAGWAVRLPVALAVPGDAPAAGPGVRVSIGGGGVEIGGVRLRPDRWDDPRPRLRGGVARSRLAEAAAGLPDAGSVEVDAATPAAVAAALAAGDPGPAVAILGRGPGLTPSGDDIVAGAAAALAVCGGLDPVAAAAVLAAAAPATTLLSAALLRCAVRGQVIPEAAALLRALCGEGAVGPAVDALLGVGESSGAALALGLCAGARISAGG